MKQLRKGLKDYKGNHPHGRNDGISMLGLGNPAQICGEPRNPAAT
jgi:hypothetical protein